MRYGKRVLLLGGMLAMVFFWIGVESVPYVLRVLLRPRSDYETRFESIDAVIGSGLLLFLSCAGKSVESSLNIFAMGRLRSKDEKGRPRMSDGEPGHLAGLQVVNWFFIGVMTIIFSTKVIALGMFITAMPSILEYIEIIRLEKLLASRITVPDG